MDYKYHEVGGSSNQLKNYISHVIEETADSDKEKETNNEEENLRIEYNVQTRKAENKRAVKLPQKYEDYELYTAYCLMTETKDPKSYKEAILSGEDWKTAINKEIDAHKFVTWKITDPPDDDFGDQVGFQNKSGRNQEGTFSRKRLSSRRNNRCICIRGKNAYSQSLFMSCS